MSKKKIKNDGIYFLGKASDDVTGSQYLVNFGDYKILLECGLHQSSRNDYLDSYKINSEKFKFKPSEIDYVFVNHTHIDHIGLLPRLVKEGFKGRIIATQKTAMVMKPLLLNSCFIVNEECRIISRRYKRQYKPLYSEEDVYSTLSLVDVYDEYEHIYKLNDSIKFQWLPNSHCVGAAQLQLIVSNADKTRKILYTSDIGALKSKNHFVPDTYIPTTFNDVVIMESTYGLKRVNKKTRKFDVKHLESAINTVLERNGSVIMPCFSFSRTQELLVALYSIYGKREDFTTAVCVDSKLSCDICSLYFNLLQDEDLELWKDIINWKNLRLITDKEDSQKNVKDSTPKIVLSSSGFCTNGRVISYLKEYISNPNNMVIFSGYSGDNPTYLSYRIKHYKDYKTISINKDKYPNNADCISLSTFSCHADYNDLIKYGSNLNTNKLVLVHGTKESKECLADGLREAISKNDKTYRVLTSVKDMRISL